MNYRSLGNSELRVSEICLGTWTTFGGIDEDAAIAPVDAAFDAGVNFFDTANIYSQGRSEEVLGRALAGRPRDSRSRSRRSPSTRSCIANPSRT